MSDKTLVAWVFTFGMLIFVFGLMNKDVREAQNLMPPAEVLQRHLPSGARVVEDCGNGFHLVEWEVDGKTRKFMFHANVLTELAE